MNDLWGYLIIEELVRNGIDYFVVSPGSRSTPLTVAVARNPRARSIMCIDERGAAFHAVGYGRATRKPAVLICTSGSAAANYYPAAIEAATNQIPLIIISSDRPPELRQTGANQAINQVNLYGSYPKWEFDLPCPTEEIKPSMVLTTIDALVTRSCQIPQGLVHLNCMFREPLAPSGMEVSLPDSLRGWAREDRPYTYYGQSVRMPADGEVERLVKIIETTQTGIIILGELRSLEDIHAIVLLANKLNWAIFPDIRSGLRLNNKLPNIVHYFDQLLLNDFEQVDTVIQFGTRLTSARCLNWLERRPPTDYVAIVNDNNRHDPSHIVTHHLESDIDFLCQALQEKLLKFPATNWLKLLLQRSYTLNLKIDNFLDSQTHLSEPAIVRTISQLIPPQHGLWLGNSMPIRDMDMYGASQSKAIHIGTNRGTSGIDGAIASASGFAVGLRLPVTAIVGDLASLHDLNSLGILNTIGQPVVVVIINNDGGGIFSFLPIADTTDVFNKYFATPHGLSFKNAANLFKLDYYQPRSRDELDSQYRRAIAGNRSAVIEVKTNREDNRKLHQDLQDFLLSGKVSASE
jgi:2-succinyl-5-enolpyruvyl-6-hydroxy-3-cyclohexene-1-carboxylate synthase